MDIDKILYLPLAIENPPIDALDHLNNIDFARLYQDEYRSCYHVPLMYDFVPGNFAWTPYMFPYKSLREWFEDVLFPLLGRSRIVIITTPEGGVNPPHIDCSREDFDTSLQHKFRYVMQGNIDDLFFMTDCGDVQMPGSVDKPFVMKGSWPHYMQNIYAGTKYTLAYGAPWDGHAEDTMYTDLLQRSYKQYSDHCLQAEHGLPENWNDLFEGKNTIRQKANQLLFPNK